MTGRITSTFVVLAFLLGAVAETSTERTTSQSGLVDEDTRKKPGFDPRQFPGEDLTALLKDKKFSDGRHTLKTFTDGTKLSIETKNGKIRRASLVDQKGSRSEATIHSPSGTPTARSFTVGVHIFPPNSELCFICTIGRDQQQSGDARRRRLIRCHSAPCDDFFPEPEPPPIESLKKSPSSDKPKP